MLFLKTVHVDTGKPYDIFIERGIIDNCGEYISKISKAEKFAVYAENGKSYDYVFVERHHDLYIFVK